MRGFYYITLKDKDWFRNRTEQQTLHSLPNGFEARSQHQPTQPAPNFETRFLNAGAFGAAPVFAVPAVVTAAV
jgi:hypothetical protein